MADTIETFVAKLQEQGVQAGQEAAEKLQSEAQAKADSTIADAKAQAEKIIANAKAEAESIVARSQTDLELAARDTVGKLRQTLSDSMNALLADSVKGTLTDVEFLGKTLYEIVMMYTQADLEKKPLIKINVPADTRDKLKDWALRTVGEEVLRAKRPHIDLKGKLAQAGFEYEVAGGTVEVTLDSVVETLSEMVTPALREVLAKAAKSSTNE